MLVRQAWLVVCWSWGRWKDARGRAFAASGTQPSGLRIPFVFRCTHCLYTQSLHHNITEWVCIINVRLCMRMKIMWMKFKTYGWIKSGFSAFKISQQLR